MNYVGNRQHETLQNHYTKILGRLILSSTTVQSSLQPCFKRGGMPIHFLILQTITHLISTTLPTFELKSQDVTSHIYLSVLAGCVWYAFIGGSRARSLSFIKRSRARSLTCVIPVGPNSAYNRHLIRASTW